MIWNRRGASIIVQWLELVNDINYFYYNNTTFLRKIKDEDNEKK